MSTTMQPDVPTRGSRPEPLTSRIFVRCYRRYDDAKIAYDRLRLVAGIPDKRITVVARGLEWRETLPLGTLYKLSCGLAALTGALVGLALYALGFAAASVDPLTQMALAAMAGAAIGFCTATVVVRVRDRRTGGAVSGHVEPRQYDILVEEDLAPAARDVLRDD